MSHKGLRDHQKIVARTKPEGNDQQTVSELSLGIDPSGEEECKSSVKVYLEVQSTGPPSAELKLETASNKLTCAATIMDRKRPHEGSDAGSSSSKKAKTFVLLSPLFKILNFYFVVTP